MFPKALHKKMIHEMGVMNKRIHNMISIKIKNFSIEEKEKFIREFTLSPLYQFVNTISSATTHNTCSCCIEKLKGGFTTNDLVKIGTFIELMNSLGWKNWKESLNQQALELKIKKNKELKENLEKHLINKQREIEILQEKEKEKEKKQLIRQQKLEKRLEEKRLEEKRLEEQRLEEKRLEEKRLEEKRLEEKRLEEQRLEEQRLEEQRLEEKRLEEKRLEQKRIKQERHEQKRIKQERIEQKRIEQKRLEEKRIEQERLEEQRLEQERLEQERLEQACLEQERLEKKRLEKQRLEKQRLVEKQSIQQDAFRNNSIKNYRNNSYSQNRENKFNSKRLNYTILKRDESVTKPVLLYPPGLEPYINRNNYGYKPQFEGYRFITNPFDMPDILSDYRAMILSS